MKIMKNGPKNRAKINQKIIKNEVWKSMEKRWISGPPKFYRRMRGIAKGGKEVPSGSVKSSTKQLYNKLFCT